MATAAPTDYTNQVEYTEETAEFSPAVIEEMRSHLAKYPPERKRSALIPLLLLVVQRERGWIASHPNLQNAFLQDYGRAGNHRAHLQQTRHSRG
jgi:hypothetical protein